jgi:hypothetical protein
MGGGGRFILFNRTLVSKTAVAPTRMMVTAATTKEVNSHEEHRPCGKTTSTM